jgi:RHS repeat-associated protein
MITSLQAPVGSDYTAGAKLIQGMAYKYDQLNRLKTAVGYNSTNTSNTTAPFVWAGSGAQRYANSFTYDANGNILTQSRADQANVVFDNLSYAYDYDQDGFLKNNRLRRVDDAVSGSLPLDDIEDQGSAYNYVYDAIGQLVLDNQEQIASIDWRIDGKIASINRTSGSGKADLDFEYDALGNRVAKKVVNGGQLTETIYYIRDANGEVMAVYQFTLQQEQAHLKLQEQHIYGSARLGVRKVDEEMIGAVDPSDVGEFDRVRGMKRYELSNHLGNVLTVISDRKIATVDNGVNIYYHAEIISYSDYYPFGAPMSQSTTDRTWSVEEYRFGFQNQEEDNELWEGAVTYKYRIEDPRLGRFFSVDPLYADFPWNSNYAFSENRVVDCLELEGLEAFKISDATATIFDETSGQPKEIPRKVLTLTDPSAPRLTIIDENGNQIQNFKYCYFISMMQGLSVESSFSENTLSPSYVIRVPQLEEFKTFTANTFELTTDPEDQQATFVPNGAWTGILSDMDDLYDSWDSMSKLYTPVGSTNTEASTMLQSLDQQLQNFDTIQIYNRSSFSNDQIRQEIQSTIYFTNNISIQFVDQPAEGNSNAVYTIQYGTNSCD